MSDMPYHILDGGKVRCHVCGALLRWVDSIETEIGYSCEDHILEDEPDEPAGGEHPLTTEYHNRACLECSWYDRDARKCPRARCKHDPPEPYRPYQGERR